jgi:SAM-dependent methyltransferase
VTAGKQWPILPTEAPRLLRALGILNADASMSADSTRKLSQVNHLVTLLLPALEDLAKRHATVRILDAGCGNSYLTLALAWLFAAKWKKPALIIGIDSRNDVVATSTKRAAELGYAETLKFETASISADYAGDAFTRLFGVEAPARPHLVAALHACDTATDDAMQMAVNSQADVIAVAPCCQAELARKWKDLGDADGKTHPFAPVFKTPNLRRETAAQLTDAMRLLVLRGCGYEVTATEFVPSAHTPKNRLLLALRRGRFHKDSIAQYHALVDSLAGAGIKSGALLDALEVD